MRQFAQCHKETEGRTDIKNRYADSHRSTHPCVPTGFPWPQQQPPGFPAPRICWSKLWKAQTWARSFLVWYGFHSLVLSTTVTSLQSPWDPVASTEPSPEPATEQASVFVECIILNASCVISSESLVVEAYRSIYRIDPPALKISRANGEDSWPEHKAEGHRCLLMRQEWKEAVNFKTG